MKLCALIDAKDAACDARTRREAGLDRAAAIQVLDIKLKSGQDVVSLWSSEIRSDRRVSAAPGSVCFGIVHSAEKVSSETESSTSQRRIPAPRTPSPPKKMLTPKGRSKQLFDFLFLHVLNIQIGDRVWEPTVGMLFFAAVHGVKKPGSQRCVPGRPFTTDPPLEVVAHYINGPVHKRNACMMHQCGRGLNHSCGPVKLSDAISSHSRLPPVWH